MRPTHRTAGYTVTELLIVVLLIGLLASMAVPAFNGVVASLRARSALDRLVANLNFARMLAVREGQTVDVRLTATTDGCVQRYSVQRRDQAGPLRTFEVASELPGFCLRHNGESVISFNTRGMLRAGAQTLSVARGQRADSVVVSFAGRVRRTY